MLFFLGCKLHTDIMRYYVLKVRKLDFTDHKQLFTVRMSIRSICQVDTLCMYFTRLSLNVCCVPQSLDIAYFVKIYFASSENRNARKSETTY